MASRKTQYLIVGGGVAGLSLADKLSKGGREAIVLEAGSSRPVGDWRRLDWYEDDRDRLEVVSNYKYNTKLLRVKALGGSVEAWEGYVPRWNKNDFQQNSLFGVGKDWPFGFDELEPYYCEAEKYLGVAGGELNPKDEARSMPYPLPPFEWTDYEREVASRTRGMGLEWHHVPQARNSLPYGRRSSCNGIGECNMCPIQARWTPRATLVPRLLANPRVEIWSESSCCELEVDATGNPCLAVVKRSDGSVLTVEFETLVLAAGAIECARLLLLTRLNLKGREGFWNNPNIGKGYMDHPVLRVKADVDWNAGRSRQTNILASSHSFRDFDKETGSWGFVLNLNRRILPKAWLAAHFEMPAVTSNSIRLSDEQSDLFGNPIASLRIGTDYDGFSATKARIDTVLGELARSFGGSNLIRDELQLWACHPMGGCPISAREGDGVVDANLKVWGSDNLYILSNGVFATGSSVNPTLTLVSLGFRLAERLLKGNKNA